MKNPRNLFSFKTLWPLAMVAALALLFTAVRVYANQSAYGYDYPHGLNDEQTRKWDAILQLFMPKTGTNTSPIYASGDLSFLNKTNGLRFTTAAGSTNARMGTITLNAVGVATQINNTITANTYTFVSRQTTSGLSAGSIANVSVATTPGTNILTSSTNIDNGTFRYLLIESQ